MTEYYAFITKSKGRYTLVPDGSDDHFDTGFYKYYNDDEVEDISCVAVGPAHHYALVTSGGAAYYNGSDGFKAKMREITCSDIKHISFGAGGTYAITMKGGWCHARLYPDALKKVNEHNGKISYVSLGPGKSDWIVGYENNGYANGGGLPARLTSFLSGINASKKKILLVEIGSNNRYFVDHEEGYRWNLPTDASQWLEEHKACNLSTLSLW